MFLLTVELTGRQCMTNKILLWLLSLHCILQVHGILQLLNGVMRLFPSISSLDQTTFWYNSGYQRLRNNLFIDNVNISDGNVGVPYYWLKRNFSLSKPCFRYCLPRPPVGFVIWCNRENDEYRWCSCSYYTYSNVSNEVVKTRPVRPCKGKLPG